MPAPRATGTGPTIMLRTTLTILVFAGSFLFFLPEAAFSQGETISAVIGQVSDASGAAVPGATVMVTHKETGLKRSARTDESGRFNFPQLKPGTYSVKVEAEGFEAQLFTKCAPKQTPVFPVTLFCDAGHCKVHPKESKSLCLKGCFGGTE